MSYFNKFNTSTSYICIVKYYSIYKHILNINLLLRYMSTSQSLNDKNNFTYQTINFGIYNDF